MASMNKVFLMGNLTRDPELRRVGDNNAVCNFGLAVNRRFSTSSGEEREETCFVDVETWGRQAETCERYLSKGRPVLVEGRLRQDKWEDKESGAPRSKLLIRAERVQFLGSGRGGDSEGEGYQGGGSRHDSQDTRRAQSAHEAHSGTDSYADQAPEQDDIPF